VVVVVDEVAVAAEVVEVGGMVVLVEVGGTVDAAVEDDVEVALSPEQPARADTTRSATTERIRLVVIDIACLSTVPPANPSRRRGSRAAATS